jgi:hypothetical protein
MPNLSPTRNEEPDPILTVVTSETAIQIYRINDNDASIVQSHIDVAVKVDQGSSRISEVKMTFVRLRNTSGV